jgi:NAD(P)-dependent dehydrogenase (short-subunit alcohol dehydrogenase family)
LIESSNMVKTAVVTGAGSGVGRAIALKLGAAGWQVVLLGRTERSLKETIAQAGAAGMRMLAYPCDVANAAAVRAMAAEVLGRWGVAEVLVNAAGTNVPNRALEVLSDEDYHQMIDVNMNGAYYCVQAFLPTMRKMGTGTIVNIVSDAALAASPKAGPGYVMSKFALRGLTQAINAEERGRGIRASAILPGDIDTPLLERRPQPPSVEARAKMLTPEDVADCAMLAINLPQRAIVEELLVRPH